MLVAKPARADRAEQPPRSPFIIAPWSQRRLMRAGSGCSPQSRVCSGPFFPPRVPAACTVKTPHHRMNIRNSALLASRSHVEEVQRMRPDGRRGTRHTDMLLMAKGWARAAALAGVAVLLVSASQ